MKCFNLIASMVLAVLLVLTTTSCDSGLQELNQNPNAPTEVDPEFVLPHVQKQLVEARITTQISTYMQFRSELLYVGAGLYERPNTNGQWQELYTDIIENTNYIQTFARERDDANTEAVAVILRAFAFQVMTDMWGPIPFADANLGRASSEERVLSPTYDVQEAVYQGILSELDAATDMIDIGGSPFGAEDLFYNGDMSLWRKLAHSLKLRMYMRLSEARPELARAGVEEVYSSGGYLSSNADNALLAYQEHPNSHPMHAGNRLREDDKVSATVVDTLTYLSDPRLRVYASPTFNTSEYRGMPVGVDKGHGFTNSEVSAHGAYFVSPTHPGVIMTHAEVQFLLAEAAARGWISGDGRTHYEEGVRAALAMYDQATLDAHLSGFAGNDTYNTLRLKEEEFPSGITESEVGAYLSQPGVAWDADRWRELIGLQKWILMYEIQPFEAWSEWRRLSYPELSPGPDAFLDHLPLRLPYPENEQSFNLQNLNAAIEMLDGSDDMSTRVWWDQ